MFASAYQKGLLSILYSVGSKPLQIWAAEARHGGRVERVTDPDIRSAAVEVVAAGAATTLSFFCALCGLYLWWFCGFCPFSRF